MTGEEYSLSRRRPGRTLLLVLTLAAGAWPAAAAPGARALDDAALFQSVLDDLRMKNDHAAAVAQLKKAGPQGAATMLGILAGRVRLEASDQGPLLTPAAEVVLFEAFHSWPTEEAIAAALDWLGQSTESREKLLVLRLLGEAGARDALHPFFEILAGIPQEEKRHPAVAGQVERALSEILRRDPRGHQVVASKVKQMDQPVLASVARATALASAPGGIQLLEKLTGRDHELDVVVLSVLGDWRQSRAECTDRAPADVAMAFIQSSNEKVRQQAAVALGKLQDPESVPALVTALEDPDARVRKAAHWALNGTVGGVLPGEFEPWNQWLSAEKIWFESSRETLDSLLDPAPGVALAALRTLAAHPLYRTRFIGEVAAAVRHTDVNVSRAACGTLAHLGGRCAVEPLIEALADERPEIRQVAAEALEGLTAAGLGPDRDAWRAWLTR